MTKRSIPLFALVAITLAAGVAHAVPGRFVYSGYLAKEGKPVDGTIAAAFEIYDAATGGARLWSESHTDLRVEKGLFTATLGAAARLDRGAALDGGGRWLQVSINGKALRPRVAVESVPYALVAGNATGDITPRSISVGGQRVVDATGRWVGATAGLAGKDGRDGVRGSDGARGRDGVRGRDGKDGKDGRDGNSGKDGKDGKAGNPGAKGSDGVLAAADHHRQAWTTVTAPPSSPLRASSYAFLAGPTIVVRSGEKVAVMGTMRMRATTAIHAVPSYRACYREGTKPVVIPGSDAESHRASFGPNQELQVPIFELLSTPASLPAAGAPITFGACLIALGKGSLRALPTSLIAMRFKP